MIFRYSSLFADKIRLLHKISWAKCWNYLLIYLGWKWSAITKKVYVPGFPFSLSLETASVCNLRCPECMTGIRRTQRQNKYMDVTLAVKKLHIHRNTAFYCNLYAQGEPFLHFHLPEIIHQAHSAGYYTVISTNGHFLNEKNCESIIRSGLDRIIISLDGLDQTTYAQYRRGGDFAKVIRGIEALHEMRNKLNRKNPLIVVQFLVTRNNEGQMKKAPEFVKDLGADILQFKSIQVYSSEGKNNLLPPDKKLNRYKNRTPSMKRGCFRLWSHAIYNSDGTMVPCCFDKIPEHPIGQIENKKGDLWKSPQMQNFRKQVLTSAHSISICRNCI